MRVETKDHIGLPPLPSGFLIAGLDELVEAIRRNTEMQGLAVLLKDCPRCCNRECPRFATWVAGPAVPAFSAYGCDLHHQADHASGWTEMPIAIFVRRLEALLAAAPE